jgi:mannose-6-phosphate isomerase-like protein (cupin superfamily)
MKIACSLLFSALFTCIALGQSTAPVSSDKDDRSKETCPWPANLDAVKAAPETHKVIFENEHVRVLEVTIAPHSKEPIHAHCWPSTLYVQQGGDIIDRDANGKVLFDSRQLKVKPTFPFVQWTPPQAPHSVENLADVPMKLIRIENKD